MPAVTATITRIVLEKLVQKAEAEEEIPLGRLRGLNARVKLFRARIFSPIADPFAVDAAKSYVYYDDGYLAIDGDRITGVGDWRDVRGTVGAHAARARHRSSRRDSSTRISTRRSWR